MIYMYVLIANGYKGIIESKETLDVLSSIYPYPKFRAVRTREDALKFLRRYDRGIVSSKFSHYGDTDNYLGFASISYIINKNDLYINIDTSKVGFIRVFNNNKKDIVIDNRFNLIKIKIIGLSLNDDLISDHCMAILNILEVLGSLVDVNINIPDISIYLAIKKYSGNSYIIKNIQEVILNRLGGVSFTIDS